MVALKFERRAFLLSVHSSSYPIQVEPIGLEETLDIIAEIHSKGEAIVLLNDKGAIQPLEDDSDEEGAELEEGDDPTNAIYIADMKIDKNKKECTILINRGDPQLTNPAFTSPTTNSVRIELPEEDESVGYSAHLVIGFGERHQNIGHFRATLEKMPNISRTVVFQFLNRILLKHADRNPDFVYKSRKDEDKPFRPLIKSAAKISTTLRKDLEVGYATSVELIDRQAEYAGIDANPKIRDITKRLQMKVVEVQDSGSFIDLFKKIQIKGKEDGYDEIQVHVRGLPGNVSASPRFDVDRADAADMLYARTIVLSGFDSYLEQCYARISAEIESKLVATLRNKSLWP